MLTNAIPASGL